MRFNTTGLANSAFGSGTLQSNSTGERNVAVGFVAMGNSTTGSSNVAIGSGSMFSNTTGNNNAAVGRGTLYFNMAGNENSAFGYYALENNTASGNSAFGFESLRANTTGTLNTGIGTSALETNTIGLENSAIGYLAMRSNTIGSFNNAVGGFALQNNTSGSLNSAFGGLTLGANTTGNGNSGFGSGVLWSNTTGEYNTAVGFRPLSNNTTGGNNSAIGNLALNSNSIGMLNSAFGAYSDVATGNLTNATAIGSRAQVAASNSMVLGSINGVNGATASTNVGIGTTSPQTRLDIMDENVVTNFGVDGNLLVRTNNPQAADIGGSITLGGMIDDAALLQRNFASIEGRKTNSVLNSNSGYLMIKTNNAGALGERMRITATGDVGIGTATPGGQLELSLNEGRKPGSTTWTVVSDSRLKIVDGVYTKGLNEIIQLQPIRYHYKNNGDRIFEQEVLDTEFAGFIAQEVQPLFPEAVQVDEDGFLNFNMHSILVASINSIKELNAKIEYLAKELESNNNSQLQEKVNILEERIKKLEALLLK